MKRAEEVVQQPVEREQPEDLRRDKREADHHHPDHHLHRARAANQQRDAIDDVRDDQDVRDILPSQSPATDGR